MKKSQFSLLLGLFFSVIFPKIAFAQDFNDVGINIIFSIESLPGLLAALSYLAGLVMGVSAIFKTVDHVTSPTQTPLGVPVIRFLVGGALFSLPIITEAIATTIGAGSAAGFDPSVEAASYLNATVAGITSIAALGTSLNDIMSNIHASTDLLPGLVTGISYLLGLVISVAALYKTRDHVEDPNRVPLKEPVIRFLTAGALFALPTVFYSMYNTIADSGLGVVGLFISAFSAVSFIYSTETGAIECLLPGGTTLGGVVCNSFLNTSAFPIFLSAIAYFIGLVFGVWGIFKIRDHVIDPTRVAISEGLSRLIAGGAFFALPYLTVVFKASFVGPVLLTLTGVPLVSSTNTGFRSSVTALTCGGTNSLDEAMGCFMQDILGPSHVVLNFFCFVAGMIFIMIGISRLIKSAQEGPRGPGGIGTFGTFVIGGMLLSATTLLRAFSSSMFTSPVTFTFASMQYTTGMSIAETQAAYNVISAVLQFMIIIGMLSFVRGLFIMRDVAEGKGQASTMAGVTHLIGGALAVNLGPMLNAIQQTLGITAFGVSFGLP